jgi:hypothetical protein
MKALLICLVCMTIPLTVNADMVSFDQYVFDRATLSGSFTKSNTGTIKFVLAFGHSLSAAQASYICDQRYTHWKDMTKYAKQVAKHLNKTDYIDPIKILTEIGLTNVREGK